MKIRQRKSIRMMMCSRVSQLFLIDLLSSSGRRFDEIFQNKFDEAVNRSPSEALKKIFEAVRGRRKNKTSVGEIILSESSSNFTIGFV